MTDKQRNKRRLDRGVAHTKAGKALFASCIGMALFTALLFLAAVICLRADAAGWCLPLASYLCCAISAFAAGCVAAKSVGSSGLLCGLASSVPLCILLLILCLALYGSVASGFFIGTAILLFFGATGGITVLNLKRKRRYR